jgi:hypothetical protein
MLVGSHGHVPVPSRRRKTMSAAKAKEAFKKIVHARHERNKTSATADLQRIEAAPDAFVAWGTATEILKGLPAAGAEGCCTYTIDGQNFAITMTSAECDLTPSPHNFDPRGPCS